MKKACGWILASVLILGLSASCSRADTSKASEEASADASSTALFAAESSMSESAAPAQTAADSTTEPAAAAESEEAFTDAVVTVQFAKDAAPARPYDTAVVETGEMQTQLVFSTDAAVRDFCVLALTDPDIDDNGEIHFKSTVAHRQDRLTPDRPLVVTTVFFGDIPNNGISYMDKDGVTHSFTVDMSGEDGSLYLTEFH